MTRAIRPARIAATALFLQLAACTAAAPPDPCAGWSPIRPERGETQRLSSTLRAQLLAHNVQGQKLQCWEP